MDAISVSHPQDDMYIVVRRGKRVRVAVLVLAVMGLMVLNAVPRESTVLSALILIISLFSAPVFAVAAVRAWVSHERVVVRRPGQLLVDGDPVEFARVELRVVEPGLRRRVKGFALSLWVMGANGPEDIVLGTFPSLLTASTYAEEWEGFLAKANLKQSGRTKKRAG